MAIVTADRVKETTTTTGTGALTLGGAVSEFRTFASAFGSGTTAGISYCIHGGTEWEVGKGTFNGTTGLTRDTVEASSNSGSAVNFSAGTKHVYATFSGVDASAAVIAASGTFTPAIAFGGGTTGITYSYQVGRYERYRNTVRATIAMFVTARGSSTGNMTVTGLPFTTKNTTNFIQAATVGLIGGISAAVSAWAAENATVIKLFKHSTQAFVTNSDVPSANFDVIVNFVYECEP